MCTLSPSQDPDIVFQFSWGHASGTRDHTAEVLCRGAAHLPGRPSPSCVMFPALCLCVILAFFPHRRFYLWRLQWRSDPGRYLEAEPADFSVGEAASHDARASLFSLCSCDTGKFVFSRLLCVFPDERGIFLGRLARKNDPDIGKLWVTMCF